MVDKEITHNPWTITATKEVLDTPWVRVMLHDVINPGQEKGIYAVTHFKNLAIGIMPLDEHMNTWIVGQFRFPLGQYSWEIPEGGGSVDIDPLESAKRELKEETGIEAADWKKIQVMHLSNSATDEIAYLYVARKLTFGEAMPDSSEELKVKKIPFDQLYKLVCEGEVTDAMTVASVLRVKLMIMEGNL